MTEQTELADKITEYKKILKQDRKSLVFVPLTAAYVKADLMDDALETALKGTWELPDYAPGFVAVGRVYTHRQVPTKAESAFQKALEIDPSSLAAYKGLARLYHSQGNNDAASNLLTKAIFLFPEESSLKQMLESLAPAKSGPSAVPADSSPELKEDEMKPITTATIAEIYIEQGLYDKALDVYRELYSETKAPEVAQKIAEIESLAQGNSTEPPAAVEVVSTDPAPQVAPAVEPMMSEPTEPASDNTVLGTLNSMLASIQARRSRV